LAPGNFSPPGNGPLDEAAERAQRAYNAAADTYDAPANGFWEATGRETIARLGLAVGARVIDLPCGSGASALAAAKAVGAGGSVLGVDLARGLLARARSKATAARLGNIRFMEADMRATGCPSGAFDAVVCVFGVFFVPDREALVRELWRLVAPGGVLAITTWGPDPLEPGASAFWAAVAAERPRLVHGFNPWDELVRPEQLLTLFERSGITDASASLVEASQSLRSGTDWWDIALGSGFRGTIEELDDTTRKRVRRANLAAMAGVTSVRTSAVYGTAAKAAD